MNPLGEQGRALPPYPTSGCHSWFVKVEDWEKRTEAPLLLLALAFIAAYAWPILDPRLQPDLKTSLILGSYAIWVLFAIDLTIRVVLALQRAAYLRKHWYDVAFVVLPFLRSLRLVRLVVLLRLFGRAAAASMASQVLAYVAGTALLAIGLGAVAVLDVERDAPGANIHNFGDSIWWAISAVTTVGYGDLYPVTTAGRFIAALIMVVGIALVGSTTGAVASWLVSHLPDRAETKQEQPED